MWSGSRASSRAGFQIPPWTPYQSCLAGERLAEARRRCDRRGRGVDAERERVLPASACGEIDLDRGPTVAMDGDRLLIDQDHRFVEDALHDEKDALARPIRRDLDAAPITSGPLRVAQRRKLGLPDPGRADRMALAVEPRRRAPKSKSQRPSSDSVARRPAASASHARLRKDSMATDAAQAGLSKYPKS